MHPFVLYNSRLVRADKAIFSAGQLGLLSGWGVFTTLKIHRRVPFAIERHWTRLSRDAALIHVEMPMDLDAVRSGLAELLARNEAEEAIGRLCVFRSKGGRWQGSDLGPASDWILMTDDLAPWPSTVALDVRENGRYAASPFVGAKTLSWSANLTMYEEARRGGFDEVVLLNESGEVTECTSANIFAVIDGATYTPPLSSGLLPGVTREVMLSDFESDLRVRERVLSVGDLEGAEEVFITSSTRELLPVTRIRNRVLRAGEAGAWPVMERLREALRENLRVYTEAQLAAT